MERGIHPISIALSASASWRAATSATCRSRSWLSASASPFSRSRNTRTARTASPLAGSTKSPRALGVPIQYFQESAPRLAIARRGVAVERSEFSGPDTGEELELPWAFRRIGQAGARKAVIDLAKKQSRPPPKSVAGPPPRNRQAQTSVRQRQII